jgi:hypothetical protein
MSQPRGFGLNAGRFYTNVTTPQTVTCNFVVDSTNGNQLGQRSLKSNGYVESVYMNTQAGAPAGTPNLGTSRTYGVLAATTTTAAGTSTVTGNLGTYPGTAVTGYPPSTVSGVVNTANVAAQQAQATAQAAFTAGNALTATAITAVLDGQTLTPGVYKEASSTFSLAGSTSGTLILNGLGVYIFQASSTLITGAGGTPTITLTGGARAQDVYWLVGTSATINSGHGGTFVGNVIAGTSITVTTAGTVNGSLIALAGAVTLTGNIAVNTQALSPTITSGNPNPLPGYAWVTFKNNFNYYLGGFSGFVSPLSGTQLAVTSGLTVGQAYVITTLGTTTAADWTTLGLPAGFAAAVGQAFIAKSTGTGSGTGKVQTPSVSGVNSVEVVGDPNQMISNSAIASNAGAKVLVQFLSNGVLTQPANGSVIGMTFNFDRSTVTIDGL